MSSALKIYALFIGSALLMFGGGLQGLLLSVRGAEEGFPLYALGLIGTGWSVGFVAGSITVPMLVKRVGHIRAFSIMAAIGTITILLNLLWINDVGWIVLRAFSGFCFAGAAMIVESWLNEVSDNRSRGTIFSVYTTINMAASTVGQLAMSVTGVAGYVPFVIGAISFICAVLPSALTSTPQPRPMSSAKLDVVLLYKTSPLAVIAAFACGMANGTFGTLAPVFGYEQGLNASDIAYLFAVTAVLGAIAQIPFGRLSDTMDRRMVIIALSGAGCLIGFAMVLLNPAGGALMFIMFGLYGLFAYPLYAIAVAHANDFAKDGEFGRVAGGMLLILGIGLAIGPIIGSWAMNAISPVGLFIVTATFHGALAVTAFLRMRIRPVRDGTGRVRFRALNAEKPISPGTVALDPRTDEVQETIRTDKPARPAEPVRASVEPAAATAASVTPMPETTPEAAGPVIEVTPAPPDAPASPVEATPAVDAAPADAPTSTPAPTSPPAPAPAAPSPIVEPPAPDLPAETTEDATPASPTDDTTRKDS